MKRRIKGEQRVLVWDAKHEYGEVPGFEVIHSPRVLAHKLKVCKRGRFAFVAPPALFEFWCKAVWAWGGCVAIAEELADVTGTAKAAGVWGEILRKGRGYGIRTIATSQRPAEVDKTIIGNSTLIHCGRLSRGADRQYMQRELDIPREKIDGLQPLEWIERDMLNGAISCGKISFGAEKQGGNSR